MEGDMNMCDTCIINSEVTKSFDDLPMVNNLRPPFAARAEVKYWRDYFKRVFRAGQLIVP